MDDPPSSSSPLLSAGYLIRDRWEVLKKIGGGGFGEIYKARDHHSGQTCAVKVESCNSPKQVLKMEVAVLKRLQGITPHVCEFLGCGRNDKVNYVVMTILGPSLSELRKRQPHQRFTISTVLRIGTQIITAVRSIHNCGFLHRDIKPSNFAIGATQETSRVCYMLDFGLSRQYTTLTGEVRQPRQVAGFRGTVRYASVNAHQAKDLGRHDDLWSVFYMLVELAIGQLPWRKIRDKEEAGEFKAQYDHKKLIRGMPVEFRDFLDHLQSLSYFKKPDYAKVVNILMAAIKRLGIQDGDPYDWEQDFSAPSLTTASVGSPPAVKLEKQDSVKEKKVNASSSKTNCSGVGDLSENVDNKSPQIQRKEPLEQAHPLRDVNPKPILESPEIKSSREKEDLVVPQRSEHSEGGIKNKGELEDKEGDKNSVSEAVHIDNRYTSEGSDEVSSTTASKSNNKLELRYFPAPVTNVGDFVNFRSITPMKSIHTESLNKFFEMGVQKGSSKSMKNIKCSPSNEISEDHESDSLENSVSEKNGVSSNHSNSNDQQVGEAIIHPESSQPYMPVHSYGIENLRISDTKTEHKQWNDRDPTMTNELAARSLEQTCAKRAAEPYTRNIVRTNILRESDSSNSAQVLTGHNIHIISDKNSNVLTQVTHRSKQDTRPRTTSGGKTESELTKRVLHNIPPNVSKNNAIKQLRKLPPTPQSSKRNIENSSSNLPVSSSTDYHSMYPIINTTSKSEHKELTLQPRKVSEDTNHLSVTLNTPTLIPQPPKQPPPSTYSASVLARRKRFMRPQVQ